jgi:Fusaric acid resistance protein-like
MLIRLRVRETSTRFFSVQSFERSKVSKDCVVALFTARYCREPQAFKLGVESRQAVRLVMNVVLVDVFQAFPAELHDEELGQVGEAHLQEVILLQLLEFGANGKKFDYAASLVALDLGVHLGVNIFIATTVIWLLLRLGADTSPIWAISAMIPALDPQMKQAVTNFRGRIFNALLGCVTGLLFLLVGGTSEWKLPLALSATVLLSSYVIRIPAMWRQAPITAAIVIAAGLTHHSKLSGVEIGLRRVGEVMLGCVIGLLVTWLMSKIWPLPEARTKEGAATKPSSP